MTADLQLDLPEPGLLRWTFLRKVAVCMAIEGGYITAIDAAGRYGLTAAEIEHWAASYKAHGADGLKATYRNGKKERRNP